VLYQVKTPFLKFIKKKKDLSDYTYKRSLSSTQ
jgi:hypothetical protein